MSQVRSELTVLGDKLRMASSLSVGPRTLLGFVKVPGRRLETARTLHCGVSQDRRASNDDGHPDPNSTVTWSAPSARQTRRNHLLASDRHRMQLKLPPDALYELPEDRRNDLLALHAKALRPADGKRGFSGEVVFLDNGEGVLPRLTAAKYPRHSKVLSPAERAQRFLREIKLQADAHYHPNVHWPFKLALVLGVPVAFFRRWEGDLSDYIEEPTFDDVGRLALLIQLASGLAHCHARNLVHQDLKPENIFVRDLSAQFEGLPNTGLFLRPLVADFGSVNVAAEKKEFGGSRPYMAPEQWEKKPLGDWTSVFVLGVILHELMTRGVHPIGQRSHDWHRQIRPGFNRWQQNNLWRKWSESGCPIPQPVPDPQIAAIVSACLNVHPQHRPTLGDVQTRLLTLLHERAPDAAAQVYLFLATAQSQTSPQGDWQHLFDQINAVERSIRAHYPELA